MAKMALVTYELNQGGTNRVLLHLANGFAEMGHETILFSCTAAGALHDLFHGKMHSLVQSFAGSHSRWASRTFGQIMTFFAYRRWLKEHKPDIVIATGNNISWFTSLGLLSLGKKDTRLYIKTTNPIVRERDGRLVKFFRYQMYAFLFRQADKVMTLSEAETEMLSSQFPSAAGRFQRVYNAYMTDDFAASEAAPRSSVHAQPFIVLGVGRLVGQKNFKRLLRAFSAALENVPDWHNFRLRIAGDGKDRAGLVQLAEDLGISDQVEFLGFVEDIPALMGSANLFVLSSDYEGLPAVAVEALASNCPVISTDCFANARDLLDGLPGCAVTEKDETALASAMHKAFCERIGGHHLRPYAMNYSTQSAVQSHLQVMATSRDHQEPLLQAQPA